MFNRGPLQGEPVRPRSNRNPARQHVRGMQNGKRVSHVLAKAQLADHKAPKLKVLSDFALRTEVKTVAALP
jgi:hypothetical protein